MDIAEAVMSFNPEIQFICNENDYEQLTVTSDHKKPTKKQLETAWREHLKEKKWEDYKKYREEFLALTDFLVLPDYPISEENYERVKEYRQILRDLDDFESAKLPTPPEIVFEKSRRVQRIYQEDYVETFKPNY